MKAMYPAFINERIPDIDKINIVIDDNLMPFEKTIIIELTTAKEIKM